MLIPHNKGRPTTWTWLGLNHPGQACHLNLARPATWTWSGPNNPGQACLPGQACHLDLASPKPHWPGLSAWPGQPPGPGQADSLAGPPIWNRSGQARTTLARPVGLARVVRPTILDSG